jgi:hypothetical protein
MKKLKLLSIIFAVIFASLIFASCKTKAGTPLQTVINGLEKVDDTTYFVKVPNAQETFDFNGVVTIDDKNTWNLYSQENNYMIQSKTAPLEIGDNTFYVLVNTPDDMEFYTIQIRRRPIYTVDFNTDGGTSAAAQNIEEDSLAKMPLLPAKKGWDFKGWDFDFSTPITGGITINAMWQLRPFNSFEHEYIAHALGGIDDKTYTNSKEAFAYLKLI